jgi:hypothetical protein
MRSVGRVSSRVLCRKAAAAALMSRNLAAWRKHGNEHEHVSIDITAARVSMPHRGQLFIPVMEDWLQSIIN